MKCCAHPAEMADLNCRWPEGTAVTWYLDLSNVPAGINAGQAASAVAAGIGLWATACGVSVFNVSDPRAARVVVSFSPIDGPWNVVGLTELPCDGDAQARHSMRLDVAEDWDLAMLTMVAAHEFGHALGVTHAPAGVQSVMSPVYDPTVSSLLPWEIAQAQQRYGPPATPPAPAPDPGPTPGPGPATPADPSTVTINLPIAEPGDYVLTLTLSRKG